MTTPHDHTPYLDQLDDPHAFWEQRIRACRWMIAKTFGLGAVAAALAILAQGWLEHAAPIFPVISQNYGIWQSAFLLSLVLLFLLWCAALMQKFGLLQNSKQGLAVQMRIDEHNARREARLQAARDQREKLRKEREERSIYHKASGGRSTKFDY